MITDDEIRAALDHVVSRAPDPASIRAGFASRARAHRQRRALLFAGGAMAASGAIGVPAVLGWLEPGPRAANGQSGPDVRTPPNLGPAAAEPISDAAVERVAMRYRPTWLPEGFVETSRTSSVAVDGSKYQVREWLRVEDARLSPDQRSDATARIRLVLAPVNRLAIGDWRPAVTINGDDGGLSDADDHVPQVIWRIEKGLRLAVYVNGVADGRAVAVRIARSVKPDGVSGVECPLRLNWLPDFLTEYAEQQIKLSAWGPTWRSTRSVLVGDGAAVLLSVEYGPDIAAPPAGIPATVRGRSGLTRDYEGDAGGWAHVALDGVDLLVTGAVNYDEIVQVTNKLDVGPRPYRGWIGQR